MYRVYIIDRSGAYWLRRWIVDGSTCCPVLSTKRDHAMTFKRFTDAVEQTKKLKDVGDDAHVESDNRN